MMRTNYSLFLFVLAILVEPALAETSSQDARQLNSQSNNKQSYDDWYQIEIIVFKPKRPSLSDELWPGENFSYPDNMVSVSASTPGEIAPYLLSQLDSIATVPEAKQEQESVSALTTSNFHFEGRGSHNRALIESSSQDTGNAGESSIQAGLAGSEAEEATALQPELDFDQADVLLDAKQPEAYRSLPKKSFTLGTIAGSLRRSSKYDLAMHKAWLQPINSRPSPILLQTGEQYDDLFEIDGTLSISRSRYLHVQADLWFTQFEPKYDQSQFGALSPAGFSELQKNYPELIKIEQNRDAFIPIQAYPLHHSRRMRSSALHYIDHPYFGILIKIDKFQNPS
jgi:hypothetical protein